MDGQGRTHAERASRERQVTTSADRPGTAAEAACKMQTLLTSTSSLHAVRSTRTGTDFAPGTLLCSAWFSSDITALHSG